MLMIKIGKCLQAIVKAAARAPSDLRCSKHLWQGSQLKTKDNMDAKKRASKDRATATTL